MSPNLSSERWLGANTPPHGIELAVEQCIREVSGAAVDPDDIETQVIPDGDGYRISATYLSNTEDY